MRLRFQRLTGGAIALFLVLMPVLGSTATMPAAAPEPRAWQSGNNAYSSPQFGYVVEWNDDWAARERAETSDESGLDVMILSNNDGQIRVAGQSDDVSASEFLDEAIELLTGNSEVVGIVAEDRDGDVPSIEMTADRDRFMVEAHTIDDVVVVVSLRAREADYDAALGAAQNGVTLNGSPVFSGELAGPTEDAPADDSADDPIVDDEDDPSDEPDAAGIDGDSYTSPDHDFGVSWDEGAWTATASTGSNEFNELQLSGETGGLNIISGSFYDGDPEVCLEGESAYFGTEDPNIRDWEPAVDADGEPIASSGDNLAYGVFTLTYIGDGDGEVEVELVDYIECRALITGETTLAILASTTPDLYEEHIDAVLEVTNNIEMPNGSDPVEEADPALPDFDAPGATPEVEATEEPNGETGLDGNTFVSESFGFTVEVPVDWTVEDVTIDGGDEFLVVSNGLSVVTIHATDAFGGDPEACIAFARNLLDDDPAFADLRLDATSSGDPFQGADDRGAYALFTYTGDDGERWAHYIRCQHIEEGESVLILSQDVPYEDYASERQARRQIQRAIEFP